jgi:SecD/SecF fusion protein
MLPALLALVLGGCARRPPKHGIAFVVALDTKSMAMAADAPAQAQALDRMRAVLQGRLQALGVRFAIERDAAGQLLIKVPELGNDALAAVRQAVFRSGRLEFRRVWPGAVPDTTGPADVPPGYEEMALKTQHPGGGEHVERLYVKRIPELTGEALSHATVVRDDLGKPRISLQFTREGGSRFAEITGEIARAGQAGETRGRLAIVIDGVLHSAPTVMQEIPGGSAEITGGFTEPEAVELCAALNNPLDVPHRVVAERKF